MPFRNARNDIRVIKNRDPAARNTLEILLCYPGFWAVFFHRLNHWFFTHHCKVFARWLSQVLRSMTGIEIHPGAVIGSGVFIDHGMGVVIGETAVVGDDCTIYQGATLGGTGKEDGKRHPTLGNNVVVAAGAKVLGPFTVGDNSKIGAGAVVLKEVPPNSTVVGVPGRIVRQNGKKTKKALENKEETVSNLQNESTATHRHRNHEKRTDTVDRCDLDQVNLPDPVDAEMESLRNRIIALEKALQNTQQQSCDQKEGTYESI